MFDAYLQRMPLHRTERIMDASQATIYAQLTTEGRRKFWNSWTQLVSQINAHMIHVDATNAGYNPITWNGQLVSIKGLVRKFIGTFGKRSVVN